MSRGPGRIERAIRQLFDDNPNRAFVVVELAEHCYPGTVIEKKHTVSVLRAAHRVCARDPNWTERPFDTLAFDGNPHLGLCFFNHDSLESYVLSRLIAEDVLYRSRRYLEYRSAGADNYQELRALLDSDGYWRKYIEPGGAWCRHVEMHRAKRDGDTARQAQLIAEQEEAMRQIATEVRNALDRQGA